MPRPFMLDVLTVSERVNELEELGITVKEEDQDIVYFPLFVDLDRAFGCCDPHNYPDMVTILFPDYPRTVRKTDELAKELNILFGYYTV